MMKKTLILFSFDTKKHCDESFSILCQQEERLKYHIRRPEAAENDRRKEKSEKSQVFVIT